MKNNQVTFIGRIIRKTGIDELPQLVNILIGQMSLVGPRPLTDADIVRLEWDKEYYLERWKFKPGIVGLAQLSPICHKKMSWFLDRYYIRNQSVVMDIKIVAAAALIPFLGKQFVQEKIKSK